MYSVWIGRSLVSSSSAHSSCAPHLAQTRLRTSPSSPLSVSPSSSASPAAGSLFLVFTINRFFLGGFADLVVNGIFLISAQLSVAWPMCTPDLAPCLSSESASQITSLAQAPRSSSSRATFALSVCKSAAFCFGSTFGPGVPNYELLDSSNLYQLRAASPSVPRASSSLSCAPRRCRARHLLDPLFL
jgi:hypothetical protein